MRRTLKLALGIFLPILAVCIGIYGALAYRYWTQPAKADATTTPRN